VLDVPQFSWTPLDLVLEPAAPLDLPLPGSTLRGVFGHALRQAGCALERDDCTGCELAPGCGVFRLFETPDGATAHVHPWRLQARVRDGRWHARVTLFGRGRFELPLVVRSLESLDAFGLGVRRVACRLAELSSEGRALRDGRRLVLPPSRPLPAGPGGAGRWLLRFRTPTRLKSGGRTLRAADVDAGALLRSAARRVTMLCTQWGDSPWAPDADALEAWSAGSRVEEHRLEDVSEQRYSNRAQRAMPVEGFTGELVLGNVPGPAAALLQWSSVTGLGHGTTWGQGDVELVRLDSTERR
jgi:hypothetical protein